MTTIHLKKDLESILIFLKLRWIVFFVFLFALFGSVDASNYYWRITAVNSNYNNPSNWTDSPTGIGGTSPGTPPTVDDDVYFVGTPSVTSISPVGTANVRNLICTASSSITITNNGFFNIAGNVALNGNLKIVNGYVYLVNNSSPVNTSLNLGTSSQTAFGNEFYINKPGYRVDLTGDFNISGAIKGIDASFYSNGKSITAQRLQTGAATVVRTIDFSNSTVTTTDTNVASLYASVFYIPKTTYVATNSTFNCNNGYITIYCSSTESTMNFGTLNLLNPTSTTIATYYTTGSSIANVYATNLNVNSPSVLFKSGTDYIYDRLNSLNISGSLTINTKSQVIFDFGQSPYPAACNINAINVVPVGCSNQSAMVAKSPVTLTATGSAISTSNLSYYGITFAGAGVTAPKSDDAGNNTGTVTWTADATNDYYWIGGSGNWNDATHWSLTSGGTAASCVPKATDNVHVDNNSFSSDAQSITLPVSAACKNIYWTDTNRRGSLLVSDASLSLMIAGSADFSGVKTKGVYPNLYFAGSGTITSAIDTTYSSPQIVFNTTGTYTLTNDFVSKQNINISRNVCVSNQINSGSWIFHQSGTFSSGGYKIVAGRFRSVSQPASATRVLDLKDSQLSLFYDSNNSANLYALELDKTNLTTYDFSGSDIYLNTVNCNTLNDLFLVTSGGSFVFNNVTFLNTSGTSHFSFSQVGNTFNKVTINSDFQMSSYGFITNTLLLSPNHTFNFGNNVYTVEVKNLLDTRSNGCTLLTIMNATLKSDYTPFAIIGAKVQNIKALPNALTVNGGIDLGGNTNVTVTPLTSRDFYWVGGSGNWSDCSHWSIGTSGGDPAVTNSGCCLPTDFDNVYFDGKSFTAANQTVTLDIAPTINSMIWKPEAGTWTPKFAGANTLILNGSMELATGMTCTAFTGTFNFKGISLLPNSQTINTNKVSVNSGGFLINGIGRYDITNDLTASVFSFSGTGNLYTNGYSVKGIGGFYITQSAGSVVDVSNSTIGGQACNITVVNCANFNSGGTIVNGRYPNFTNSCPLTFKGIKGLRTLTGSTVNSITSDYIIDAEGVPTITGKFITDTLNVSVAGTVLTVAAGTTLTVNDTIISAGTPCNYMTLQSSNSSPAFIKSTKCNLVFPFFKVQNITGDVSAPGSSSECYQVYGNDLSGNTNLKFISPPSGTIYLNDTIIACQNMPYKIKLPTIGSPTDYQWYKDGTAISGATSTSYNIPSIGTYQLKVIYPGALCANIYQQNITAIIDTIKPKLELPKDIKRCKPFTNAGTSLDPVSVIDNCNLNRVWYTLSGATTIGPVYKSTLDGVEFKKGVTTVTWFANDTVPNTWYSGTTPIPNVTSAVFNVSVADVSAPVTTDVTYCQNDVASALSVATVNGKTIQWYDVATGGIANTTAPTPLTSKVGSTTYYVSYRDDATSCESDRTALKVTVVAFPSTPAITTAAATCSFAGTATISNYNSAYTYTFNPSGPSVGTGGVITGMTAGTNYTVTAGTTTCTSSASSQFSVAAQLPGTSLSLSPASQTVCAGESATVNATVSGGATVTSWVSDLGGITATGGVSITTGALPNKGNQPYTITLTASATNGSCSTNQQATITVLPEPGVIINPKSAVVCDYETPGLVISSLLPGTTIDWELVYTATNAHVSSGSGIDTVKPFAAALPSGAYTLKVTGKKAGCTSKVVTASVIVN